MFGYDDDELNTIIEASWPTSGSTSR